MTFLPPLPRVPLAHLPTPVEPLVRLSDQLGLTLLVKRDDQTGLAFGGNKTRKLELLVAQAQAEGATRLLTTGAVQSNHCRQTAAAAARLGLACTLVLAGGPEPASGNLLLDRLLGAEVVWTTRERRNADLRTAFEAAQAAGERPFLIPYGGSSPTGAAAYAYALEELLAQGVRPDFIVLASSSGGTQAGLVAGARLLGYTGRILGISVDEPAAVLRQRVADLASEVCTLLGTPQPITADEVWVEDTYAAPGYGVLTAHEAEAIHTFAHLEGLLLDPVYTGRAAGGLLDLARRGVFPPGSTVLFWHTGGTPGLFATRYREGLLDLPSSSL
ncbi:MAG TPA: D-cysteine desulfhydrase family protein [Anaerolineae bacterium]|nr:D-cysteine desulfhydrase family protein [Anaerolineae bacterium]HID84798.1 D-cysteine desulfhydrase family protein [Anaerolineales bacterium]HIQ08104.1 D-cysteine desulfhydrase family protein [Anaerolineaceae bacterium]